MSKEQDELVEKIQSLLIKRYGDDTVASMQKLFDSYDADKDGEIDAKELERLLVDSDVGNRFTRGMWIKGIIKNLDQDGNGSIGWDEFKQAVDR